jgi:hypothetical protein
VDVSTVEAHSPEAEPLEGQQEVRVMTDQAAAGGMSEKAVALVKGILDRGIEGLPPLTSAEALAAEYSADPAYATTRDRVKALIRWEASKNFATGFVTGVGGLATLPVAVPAAIGASWLLQARLAGAIARLHGYSLKSDRVRTLILLAIIGDSAKDVLKTAGVMVGKRLTANAISAIPGRVLIQINKLVGLRLLTKTGQTGAVRLARAIPLAGGVVGGSFDAAGCVAVGKVADRLFAPEDRGQTAGNRRPAKPAGKRRPSPTRTSRGGATTGKVRKARTRG